MLSLEAFADGEEIGSLIRSTDWSRTPLGPLDAWPPSLILHVKMILGLPTPAIIFWGPDQTQIYNAGYATIMGPRHPRYFGAPYRECWPDTYPIVYPWMQRLFEKGEVTQVEKTHIPVTRHGYLEEAYFTFTFSPLHGDTGKVEGIFQPVVEVTEAVLAERRADTLRDLVPKAEIKDPVSEIVRVLEANPRDIPFCLIYLWDEVEGQLKMKAHCSALEKEEALAEELAKAARESFVAGPRYQVHDKGWIGGKSVEPWSESVTAIFSHPIRRPDSSTPRGAVVFGLSPRLRFDDRYRSFLEVSVAQMSALLDTVTAFHEARKRAEALAELDRVKTEFFSNISHEFRTPLTLILGPAEDLLALDTGSIAPEVRDQVSLIHRNSLRLLKLVNTLLDFSRIESGRMQPAFVPTELATYTQEIVSLFQSTIEQSGLRLELDLKPLSEPLYVDRDMWEKIVLNLVSNAFKFTLKGLISIALRRTDGHVELTVRDTGTGIPEAELSRIFNRFHRVRDAHGRTSEGTGIGLALVKELVQLHGGTIRVQSQFGEGSVFTVSILRGKAHLPANLLKAPPGETKVSQGTKPYLEEAMRSSPVGEERQVILERPGESETGGFGESRDGGRVFIVEDNRDVCEHLNRILSRQWVTEVYQDGESALSAAILNPPDLILSDVMMPGMGGFGLLRALRERSETAQVPFILLSARAGEEATVEGMRSGADDYLVKPFSSRELLARVGGRIEIARLRKHQLEEEREYVRRLRESEAHQAELLVREQSAHAEAEKHRHRLHALFMEAPALVALFRGPDHVVHFQNPNHQKLYGNREILGKPIREVLPPPQGQALFDILDEVYRTGESFHGREFPMTADWGEGLLEEKYFNIVYQPTRESRGAIDGIAVFAFEVTDQVRARKEAEAIAADLQRQHKLLKQVETALRESEERLLLSLESARLGAWDCHLPEGIVDLTDRARDILDVTPDAAVTLADFLDSVHPEDAPRVQRELANGMRPEGGGQYAAEYRILGFRDRKERWVAVRGQVYFNESRLPVRFLGTVLDIMERKRAELEIHKLTTLIEESRDLIMILDLDGSITYRNKAAKRWSSSGIGQTPRIENMFDLAFPEDQEAVLKAFDTALERGYWEGEFWFKDSRTGTPLPVWWNVFVLKDPESGKPFALASVSRDLTPLKETEERLRQTQKMEAVGKLAGGIAHDFNNLLTAINGYSDLALSVAHSPEIRGFLEEIRKSGERAATLTRQLLAYSRKQVLALKHVDLNAIVKDMEQMLKRLIGEDIELSTRLDPDLGVCRADPGQVEQIILNLVFNARDAMPEGGRLSLETGNMILDDSHGSTDLEVTPGPYAMLSVGDTGTGMDQETQGRIFEPFFTTKEVGKGTGLGLSSVFGILRQSGGTISVESAPGSGSTFRVFLPIVEAEPGHLDQPREAPLEFPRGRERVLLVEDETPVRKFVRHILEMHGYKVMEAGNGREALDFATHSREPVQVLLTDVVMPKMGGQKLAEEFRTLHPEAAVIFMSGYSDSILATQDSGAELVAFLKKPFTSAQLLEKIQSVINEPARPAQPSPNPGPDSPLPPHL